jgi:ATP-dependent DNA ligase
VNLYSRRGNHLTSRYSAVVEALRELPDETVIDREPVALDEQARPSASIFA